eukprot:gene9007-1106_t
MGQFILYGKKRNFSYINNLASQYNHTDIPQENKKKRKKKIIIFGDKGVGKSSLIEMYCYGTMTQRYIITCDFPRKKIMINNDEIELEFWDPSGQDRYIPTMFPGYFRSSNSVIFIFDITKEKSFDKIRLCHDTIEKNMELYDEPGYIDKILVGNKIDLEEEREISTETAKRLGNSLGMHYVETSVLKNSNIDEVFVKLFQEFQSEVEHFYLMDNVKMKLLSLKFFFE